MQIEENVVRTVLYAEWPGLENAIDICKSLGWEIYNIESDEHKARHTLYIKKVLK